MPAAMPFVTERMALDELAMLVEEVKGRLMPGQHGGGMVRGGQRLLQAPPSPQSGIPPLRGWREYLHLPIAFATPSAT
jgi:hypothetical protein